LNDGAAGSEELVLLALDYEAVAAPSARAVPVAATAVDELRLGTPATVLTGQQFDVILRWNGSGLVHAVSALLGWDATIASPIGASAGAYLTAQNGVTFMPAPGRIDAAVLGAGRPGLVGAGDLVVVRVEAHQTGVPAVQVLAVEARDGNNQPVATTVDVETGGPVVPARTGLAFASANPARGSVTLRMDLAESGPADLDIFGVDGRRIRGLVHETRQAGEYRVVWDGRDQGGSAVAPGVYIARLTTRGGHWTRALVWLR
jgi:hypothetical protein